MSEQLCSFARLHGSQMYNNSGITNSTMTILHQLKLDIMAWHQFAYSPWTMLCVAMVCVLVVLFVQKTRSERSVVQVLPQKEVLNLSDKSAQSSPFFAYLGHNAVTESARYSVAHTTIHASQYISRHGKSMDADATRTAESEHYSPCQPQNEASIGTWRSHSYADSSNRQVSFEHFRLLYEKELVDNGEGGPWSTTARERGLCFEENNTKQILPCATQALSTLEVIEGAWCAGIGT